MEEFKEGGHETAGTYIIHSKPLTESLVGWA